MVHSRLEKIGTIYTRIVGLMKTNSLKWEDRPLWFDIYEKFPPKEEPRFDRPAPNIPLRKIFYAEDKVRAWLHKNHKQLGAVNLTSAKFTTTTQNFIEIYNKLEAQYQGGAPQEQICQEALELLKRERKTKAEAPESLSEAFQEASQPHQKLTVDVKDIFRD